MREADFYHGLDCCKLRSQNGIEACLGKHAKSGLGYPPLHSTDLSPGRGHVCLWCGPRHVLRDLVLAAVGMAVRAAAALVCNNTIIIFSINTYLSNP